MAATTTRWDRVNDCWMYSRIWSVADGVERPPLVLVHGLCVSSLYLAPLARVLASGFNVYAPDLPGFGRSEKPDYVLSVAELAEVLARWMSIVGLQRAPLLGNSLGCQIIADMAVLYPKRVPRAVLVGPTIDAGARTLVRQALRGLWDMLLYEQVSLWPILASDYARAGLRRCVRTFQAMRADPIEERLPYIQVPVMIVRGTGDPIVSQHWAEHLLSLLPMGRLTVLPGAGHAPNYSEPANLAAAVEPFLLATPALELQVAA